MSNAVVLAIAALAMFGGLLVLVTEGILCFMIWRLFSLLREARESNEKLVDYIGTVENLTIKFTTEFTDKIHELGLWMRPLGESEQARAELDRQFANGYNRLANALTSEVVRLRESVDKFHSILFPPTQPLKEAVVTSPSDQSEYEMLKTRLLMEGLSEDDAEKLALDDLQKKMTKKNPNVSEAQPQPAFSASMGS